MHASKLTMSFRWLFKVGWESSRKHRSDRLQSSAGHHSKLPHPDNRINSV